MFMAFAMISRWWPQGLYNPGRHGGFYSGHLLALVEFVIVGSTQYFPTGHEITVSGAARKYDLGILNM